MTATQKIGYAVVGLGSIAKSSVLPAFAHCRRSTLVAVVGRVENDARSVAKEFGASAAYGARDYAACLADPGITAVYIATPQGSHLELTTQAAKEIGRAHV